MTLRCRNHMKILIFRGTFIFQIYLRRYLVCPLIRSRYIDLTVNKPEEVKPQINTSCVFVRLMSIKRLTSASHFSHLFLVKDLRNATFKEVPDKILATETCFRWTILVTLDIAVPAVCPQAMYLPKNWYSCRFQW